MTPTQELVDDIYRDKVRAARAASMDEKLWIGEELFHYAAGITMAGIRHQHPEADEAEDAAAAEENAENSCKTGVKTEEGELRRKALGESGAPGRT